ncbi:phosphoadenylyl-sulfate reductase [Isoptericola sp. NPDC057391]|uniref:phosphoadenylyl-sulfate reductase n=1 Tax=Isoptericola sp. NPDC057391 TaxID=3346117 RepID=UPI0036307D5F
MLPEEAVRTENTDHRATPVRFSPSRAGALRPRVTGSWPVRAPEAPRITRPTGSSRARGATIVRAVMNRLPMRRQGKEVSALTDESVVARTFQRLQAIERDHAPAVLANAFGPESMILTDLIVKHGLDIEVVSLDTGRLPEETYRTAQNVRERYGPVVQMVSPDASEVQDWVTRNGPNAFYESVELRRECCAIRKVRPLARVLAGKRAWLTGLRRAQSVERAELPVQSWDEGYGIAKFNPMVDWSTDEVWAYIREHSVPYNALHDRGYPSIGCAPCTRAVSDGEDQRAGRWWWELDESKECGIHLNPETGRMERTVKATSAEDVFSLVVRTPETPRSDSPGEAGDINDLASSSTPDAHGGKTMRTLVLGGDGFCGWPTALHLSAIGHEVAIVDNLSRRSIDLELEVESLTPIRPLGERLRAWEEITGKRIDFHNFDVAVNYHRLLTLIEDWRPDAIVHFAEQRAAPYSMKSSGHKRYTVSNNINATNNVLAAIVESGLDIHVAHLGTMGVYGYGTAGMKIPEGYLNVKVDVGDGELVDSEILYPVNPGSIYHMTKTQDQLLFFFYNKNDGVRVTDLHQGIVWGTQTAETRLDERLINRFDYDGDYGTVLNRFLMQAAVDHPLTVHGTGGQTRAFIHIQDTVKCIQLALENPPERGERVAIFNQMTETHRVRDLAKMIAERTGATVEKVANPRLEADENDLHVANDRFLHLGLDPITLSAGLMEEVREIARKYAHRADRDKIPARSNWRGPAVLDAAVSDAPASPVTAR